MATQKDEHVYIELDIKCRYISIFIIDYYIFFLFFVCSVVHNPN